MLNQVRWTVLLICIAVATVVGIHDGNPLVITVGIIATLCCLAGMVIDYFRERELRDVKAENAIHRRTEAFHRRANQRRNP